MHGVKCLEKKMRDLQKPVFVIILYIVCVTRPMIYLKLITFIFLEFDCDRKNIPELLISFWKPFLKMLHHLNLTPLLLQSLMTNMTERDTLRNNILGMWAYTILTASQGKHRCYSFLIHVVLF